MALSDGMLACWDFDEAGGDRVDHIGGGELAQVGVVESGVGRVGNAVSFDGNPAHYLTGGSLLSNVMAGDFTLSFYLWVERPASLDEGWMVVMGNGNTFTWGSNDFEWLVTIGTDGNLAMRLGGGASMVAGPTTPLRNREWQLVTIWQQFVEGPPRRRLLSMSLNSAAIGGANLPDVTYPHDNFIIGRVGIFEPVDTGPGVTPDLHAYPFTGMIDTLMVWQRTLTAQERSDVWNSGAALACDVLLPLPPSPVCEPLPQWIAYGATGGPEWGTALFAAPGGWEQRTQLWSQVRGRWDVAFVHVSREQATTLVDFFRAVAHGRAGSFCFRDWRDDTFDNQIATGDGTTSTFQLAKVYTSGTLSYARPLTRPIVSGLEVTVNGVLTTAYTVAEAGGLVQFAAPPPSGAVIAARGEFEVLVRFETDQLQVTCVTPNVFSCAGLGLVELIGE